MPRVDAVEIGPACDDAPQRVLSLVGQRKPQAAEPEADRAAARVGGPRAHCTIQRMIPACIHHCVSCSLSDPNDEDYCSAADHEHVSVDTMSADRDDLWDQLAELVNASIESELTKAGGPDEVIVTLVEQPKSLSRV